MKPPYEQPCEDGLPNDPNLIASLGAKLKRICCPKPASGKLDVSPEIYKQWAAGGETRNVLLQMLYKCNGIKQDSSMPIEVYTNPPAIFTESLLFARTLSSRWSIREPASARTRRLWRAGGLQRSRCATS